MDLSSSALKSSVMEGMTDHLDCVDCWEFFDDLNICLRVHVEVFRCRCRGADSQAIEFVAIVWGVNHVLHVAHMMNGKVGGSVLVHAEQRKAGFFLLSFFDLALVNDGVFPDQGMASFIEELVEGTFLGVGEWFGLHDA